MTSQASPLSTQIAQYSTLISAASPLQDVKPGDNDTEIDKNTQLVTESIKVIRDPGRPTLPAGLARQTIEPITQTTSPETQPAKLKSESSQTMDVATQTIGPEIQPVKISAQPAELNYQTTAFRLSAISSLLCANKTIEGRPTTPPYKRLVETILSHIDSINQSTSAESRINELLNLENTIKILDNSLLPSKLLATLCDFVTAVIVNDLDLVELKVVEFKGLVEEITLTYDYTAHRRKTSDEQRLLSALMTNYEKNVRPVLKASEPVELKIGLTLNQIDIVSRNLT